jgi:MFS family permease
MFSYIIVKIERLLVFPLFIAIFVAAIPASLIIPMLPFIGQKYGASSFEVSLLFTLMPMVVIVVAPIWGKLSDKFGRKPMFVSSLFCSGMTFVLFGLADSLESMFVVRGLQGLIGGNTAVAFAMVADLTDNQNRARSLGYASGSMALAFFMGPLLGGFLMGENIQEFSHVKPAFLGAGLAFIATIIAAVSLDETKERIRSKTNMFTSPFHPPRTKIISGSPTPIDHVTRLGIGLLVMQFFIGGYISGSDQFTFPFWAESLYDWGPKQISYGIGTMGLAYMIATFGIVGPCSEKLGDRGTYIVGCTINVLGLIILLSGHNVWVCTFGLWLAVVGTGIWNTILSSILTKVTPSAQTGYMLGLSNGFSMAGRVCGPLLAGAFLLDISVKLPYVITLCIVLLVLINLLLISIYNVSTDDSDY